MGIHQDQKIPLAVTECCTDIRISNWLSIYAKVNSNFFSVSNNHCAKEKCVRGTTKWRIIQLFTQPSCNEALLLFFNRDQKAFYLSQQKPLLCRVYRVKLCVYVLLLLRGGHVRPVFEIRKRVSIPLGQIVLDRLSTRSFPLLLKGFSSLL